MVAPVGDTPDVREVLTVRIMRGEANAYYATCDQHRGLLTCEQTISDALASVAPALRELLAAGPPHPDPKAFDGLALGNPPPDVVPFTREKDELLRDLTNMVINSSHRLDRIALVKRKAAAFPETAP